MVELREQGLSTKEIAERFNVVGRTVDKVLRDANLRKEARAEVAPPPPPRPALEPLPPVEPHPDVCPHCGQPWPHKENPT